MRFNGPANPHPHRHRHPHATPTRVRLCPRSRAIAAALLLQRTPTIIILEGQLYVVSPKPHNCALNFDLQWHWRALSIGCLHRTRNASILDLPGQLAPQKSLFESNMRVLFGSLQNPPQFPPQFLLGFLVGFITRVLLRLVGAEDTGEKLRGECSAQLG